MKFLLQLAVIFPCFFVWLVVGQQFILNSSNDTCLKTSVEYGVMSVTLCSMRCSVKGCLAFQFQDGLCRIYRMGYIEPIAGMQYVYRSFSGLANIASGKAVTASPQDSNEVAEHANDCNLNTIYHSAYNQPYAWWNVDLGDPVFIHVIRVIPAYTSELYLYRFHDVEVSVGSVAAVGGDASTYTVIGTYIGPFSNSSCCSVEYTLDPPVLARYVHVRLTTAFNPNQDYLIMKEVEVF